MCSLATHVLWLISVDHWKADMFELHVCWR